MEIRGKKALVTGGAVRVGREIALNLAAHGANILLHYNRSKAEAEKTASEIRALGVTCDLVSADLADPKAIDHMLKGMESKGQQVDILINSASLFFKTPLESVQESDWDKLHDVNLKACFLLSVRLGNQMRKRKGGKIVNIVDWSGFRPYKNYAAYCASKGGLITLTKSLARDLAPDVLVNAVAPGPVLLPEDFSETEKQAIEKLTAVGRIGTPKDVANAVSFLLDNNFVNGTVLVVDGGRSIV